MRRILPSWWKTAIVAAGLLLLAVLVFRAGGPKPKKDHPADGFPEDSNPAQTASALNPSGAGPWIQAHEAPTTQHAPAEANSIAPNTNVPALASAALEERRRMLNERRDLAQQLMRQSPGDLVNRL